MFRIIQHGRLNGELREFLLTMLVSAGLVACACLVFIEFKIVTIPGVIVFLIQLLSIIGLWKIWRYTYLLQLLISLTLTSFLVYFWIHYGYSHFKLVSFAFVAFSFCMVWRLKDALDKFFSKNEKASSQICPIRKTFSFSLEGKKRAQKNANFIESAFGKAAEIKIESLTFYGHFLGPYTLGFAPGEGNGMRNWVYVTCFYSVASHESFEFIYETRENDQQKANRFIEKIISLGFINKSLFPNSFVGPISGINNAEGQRIAGAVITKPPDGLPQKFIFDQEPKDFLYIAGIDLSQLKQIKGVSQISNETSTQRVKKFINEHKIKEFGICNLP